MIAVQIQIMRVSLVQASVTKRFGTMHTIKQTSKSVSSATERTGLDPTKPEKPKKIVFYSTIFRCPKQSRLYFAIL